MSKLSYKRLFKKLIDIEMKNTELMDKAKVSRVHFTRQKMVKILLQKYS